MKRVTGRTSTKARTAIILTTAAALILMVMGAVAQQGEVVWQGHGDEHVGECPDGYHWVFTTGGAVVANVTLHGELNGTELPGMPMDQAGPSGTPSAWHLNTTVIDTVDNETPFVTFDVVSSGRGEMILTISDCAVVPPPGGEEPCIGPQWIMGEALDAPPRNALEWDSFAGATGYNLYRATEGGAFSLLVQTDGNTTSYVDADVEPLTTYEYRVTAQVGDLETDHCDMVEITAIPVFPTIIATAMAAVLGVGAYAATRRRS